MKWFSELRRNRNSKETFCKGGTCFIIYKMGQLMNWSVFIRKHCRLLYLDLLNIFLFPPQLLHIQIHSDTCLRSLCLFLCVAQGWKRSCAQLLHISAPSYANNDTSHETIIIIIIIIISCHRFSFFPGTSALEPVVNPTTQASSLSL
jgi:hypothetical protein